MKKTNMFYILIVSTFLACQDDLIDPIPDCDDLNHCAVNACHPDLCIPSIKDTVWNSFDTVWRSRDIGGLGVIKEMLISKDKVFLNTWKPPSDYNIVAFDRSNGNELWHFNEVGDVHNFSDMHYDAASDRIILQEWNKVVSLEASNGMMVSSSQTAGRASATYGELIDGKYYYPESSLDRNVCYILSSSTNNLQDWDTVYAVTADQVYGNEPSINSMNLWIHPETGDEILVFQHRMAFPGRIDIVAYNMTADSIYWWQKDVEPTGNSNIQQIPVYDDVAVLQGNFSLSAYDMFTGEQLWMHDYSEETVRVSFQCCADLAYDPISQSVLGSASYFVPNGDSYSTLFAIDLRSGSYNWENRSAHNNNFTDVTTYNGLFFGAMEILYAINSESGERYWEESNEQLNRGFFELAIDDGILYTTYGDQERINIYAIKLPEEW